MLPSLTAGVRVDRRLVIDRSRCITFMGPEAMVYATPWMVSDAEYACHDAIVPHLHPGESSVGVQVHIDHLAATPVGLEVTVEVRVVQVEQRRVTFEFTVHDAVELVGRGRHVRVVVDTDRTIARLKDKRLRASRGS